MSETRFTIETLPAHLLSIDHSVQRKLNEGRVRRIADNFHEKALGVFIVSRRSFLDPAKGVPEDVHVVLDGQTRLAALRRFTGTEDTALPVTAQIFHDLTRAEEAEIFLEHNDRAAVRKIDLFRLALIARQEWALALDATVSRHGFDATDSAPPERRFTAISTAQRVMRLDDGLRTLARAFDLIERSWGHRVNAASAESVEGLAMLIHWHRDDVDVVGFAKKLAATDTPQTFKANVHAYQASMGGSRTEAAYRYTIKVYNSGRRSRGLEPRS